MFGPDGRDDFLLIYKAHHEKLVKLNAGSYEPFKRNELFIQSNIFADDQMCSDALRNILDQNRSHAIAFDLVTVSIPGANIRFDFKDTSFEILPFSRDDQFDIACQAREAVIEGEDNGTANCQIAC